LRPLRHWVTARLTDTALRAAPWLSPRTIDDFCRRVARCGVYAPIIRSQIARNMQSLGVYSPAALREHFLWLGGHFAGAIHALRCAARTAGPSPELARLAADRIALDPSVEPLAAAATQGRGAIVVGPHITNYLLSLTRLNAFLPLTCYLRYSKDGQRRAAKQRWYQASGVGWISEPPAADRALGRLGTMAQALRSGQTLYVTPDLPQKRDAGTPVRFFGRTIYLPAGAGALAVRTGAPLYVLLAERTGDGQRLFLRGPWVPPREVDRKAAVALALQWFATHFESFLRRETPLWYLWGDKRWTRVLRGDPRYVGEPAAAAET
jgi:lauroyl/myristoyl acyltransferase